MVEESSSGVTSVGFILDPDVGEMMFDCNTYDDTCADGQKCNAYADNGGTSWNALGCFDLDPAPVDVGESCTVIDSGVSGMDNCVQGAICWNVDAETNIGTCVAYCEGTPGMGTCANGSPCTVANEDVLNLCLPACDPLVQDCNAGEVCIPVENVFVCAPDASGGMGDAGVPCDFLNVCNPGLWCAEGDVVPGCLGGFGCCDPFCDTSDGAANMACDELLTGTECVPFFAMGTAPMGLENLGICTVP